MAVDNQMDLVGRFAFSEDRRAGWELPPVKDKSREDIDGQRLQQNGLSGEVAEQLRAAKRANAFGQRRLLVAGSQERLGRQAQQCRGLLCPYRALRRQPANTACSPK
jgi:hypothetical protein